MSYPNHKCRPKAIAKHSLLLNAHEDAEQGKLYLSI